MSPRLQETVGKQHGKAADQTQKNRLRNAIKCGLAGPQEQLSQAIARQHGPTKMTHKQGVKQEQQVLER